MKRRKVVCIGGPTGAGKDTILTEFMKGRDDYVWIPRCTTRPRRHGEIEGRHYFFLDREQFVADQAAGHVCAVDTFCRNLYGVDVRRIIRALEERKQVVGIFGICSLKLRLLLNGVDSPIGVQLVYVTASLEAICERLIERGHTDEEIRERMSAAQRQLDEEPNSFDVVIENSRSLDEAVKEFARAVE